MCVLFLDWSTIAAKLKEQLSSCSLFLYSFMFVRFLFLTKKSKNFIGENLVTNPNKIYFEGEL